MLKRQYTFAFISTSCNDVNTIIKYFCKITQSTYIRKATDIKKNQCIIVFNYENKSIISQAISKRIPMLNIIKSNQYYLNKNMLRSGEMLGINDVYHSLKIMHKNILKLSTDVKTFN